MFKTGFLSVILGLLLNVTDVSALQCFNCSNISDPSACNTTIMCNSDEACYQDSVISGQSKTITLGCIHIKQCGVTTSGPGTLIGRDVSRRQNNQCHECCSTDHCNELLCARRNPADCIDDETIDCSRMNSVFGICKDISHAKALCPHFCGLCDVVDGVWTEWTPWSTCDVTCETGTQSRARTCTNPAPAHGGLDCIGDKAQTKQCHKQLCPVHGGWSAWEAWGTCSVTCDIGIQRRQRTCTNPAPQRFGDHCFGLSLDDRLCMSIACSNGGWTAWGSWGTCSITCGGGFRSRSRTCTNPIPSLSGKYCKGDTIQVGACSNNVCKEPNVAFRSKDVVSTRPHSGQTIVFKTATLNEGSGYDKTTGIFTAPVAGTYLFSIQLCVDLGHDVDYAIVVDGVNVKVGHFSDATWELCYSADTVAILRSGSRVWVKCDYDTCYLHQRTHYSNTFSGVLIHS